MNWSDKKSDEIQNICVVKGLSSSEDRKEVWPMLMSLNPKDFNSTWKDNSLENQHSDIISRDIERSLNNLDACESYSETERDTKRKELSQVVNGVFKHNPDLYYFQGFHDICSVFYLVGGQDFAFHLSSKCALNFIRDYMRKTFQEGVEQEMFLIYEVLRVSDTKLAQKLEEVHRMGGELMMPMFSLSWVLTWLSHDMYKLEDICRVFDFILGTHPLAPVYISAAVISQRREQVLQSSDMSEVHLVFREHFESLNVEKTLQKAFALMNKLGPNKLVLIKQFPQE